MHRDGPANVGRRYSVAFRLPELLAADAYSGWTVEWGDGTSEPASVTLKEECPGWDEVTARATHAYAHVGPYQVILKGTDTTTHSEVRTGDWLRVASAVPDRITVTVSGRRTIWTRLRVAIETGEPRPSSELEVEVRWGGGRWVRAHPHGTGRSFALAAVHRWRRAGLHRVEVGFFDRETHEPLAWERWVRVRR